MQTLDLDFKREKHFGFFVHTVIGKKVDNIDVIGKSYKLNTAVACQVPMDTACMHAYQAL